MLSLGLLLLKLWSPGAPPLPRTPGVHVDDLHEVVADLRTDVADLRAELSTLQEELSLAEAHEAAGAAAETRQEMDALREMLSSKREQIRLLKRLAAPHRDGMEAVGFPSAPRA